MPGLETPKGFLKVLLPFPSFPLSRRPPLPHPSRWWPTANTGHSVRIRPPPRLRPSSASPPAFLTLLLLVPHPIGTKSATSALAPPRGGPPSPRSAKGRFADPMQPRARPPDPQPCWVTRARRKTAVSAESGSQPPGSGSSTPHPLGAFNPSLACYTKRLGLATTREVGKQCQLACELRRQEWQALFSGLHLHPCVPQEVPPPRLHRPALGRSQQPAAPLAVRTISGESLAGKAWAASSEGRGRAGPLQPGGRG